jgi:hypothetical protein
MHLLLVVYIGFVFVLRLLGMAIFHRFVLCLLSIIFYNSKLKNLNEIVSFSFGFVQQNLGQYIHVSQYLPKRRINNGFIKKLIATCYSTSISWIVF